jgi:myo-inositol-1(or 4)-monophosphatase
MPPGTPAPLAATTIRRLMATARAAAELAGAWIARRLRPRGQAMRRKGEGDFVTSSDVAIERRVRAFLRRRHRDHGFLGEETPPDRPDAELLWVCDPIDGTSNFARGLRTCAAAVACLWHGQPVAAAMRCLPENALYVAGLGQGAFRNGRRVRLAAGTLDDAAILGVQWQRGPRPLWYLPRLLETGARIRNLGCSVVQICDVVMGRLDANLQEQGRIWDVAAPGLLVVEAGGRFTGWDGRPLLPFATRAADVHHPSLAASGPVHSRLVRLLRAALSVPQA